MDPVDRRTRTRALRPTFEAMEALCLMATALPDLAMVSAMTSDSKSVTFDYTITGADVAEPIHFEVYRSAEAQLGPDSVPVGGIDVLPSGDQNGPTHDAAGQ